MILLRDILKIIIVFCNIYYCNSKRYDNYTLFRAIPVSQDHLHFFETLSPTKYHFNFWRAPSLLMKPIEFVLSPYNRDKFFCDVETVGIYLTTIMENVQRAFDDQTVKAYLRRNMDSFDWRNYFRINDIYSWLQDLERAHSDKMRLSVIGKTHEYRNIITARVYFKNGPENRELVIIEGGIHAREWIAPAFVTYFLNQIVTSQTSEDEELKLIATQYEWIFIPVVNPDGYEYSHTTDRLWRKNRRDSGVDLNRNFGYQFGSVGVSFSRSSETYAGQTAFSEYESAAVRDLVINNSKRLDYYFSFHSYGQYIIIPYAHTIEKKENFYEMRDISRTASFEIKKLFGTEYTVGSAYDTVGYLVSGASTCWVKNSFKVPYVATIELRDRGSYGFALPPNQIIPTCRETMMGMVSFLSKSQNRKNQSYLHRPRIDVYDNMGLNLDLSGSNAQNSKILGRVVISVILYCLL